MIQSQASAVFDKKALGWGLFGLVFICLLTKFLGGAGFAILLPIVLIGFSKNKTLLLFWAIMATMMITNTNSFFVKGDMLLGIINRLIFMLVGGVMTLQIIGRKSSKLHTPLLSLLFYIAYMAIVSSQGWMPLISYLKLFLFTTIFLAFYSVSTASATRQISIPVLRSIFLCFACFFIFGSILLIPFPSISLLNVQQFFLEHGYYPEGSLFMGITKHSQALGPITTVFVTILLADWLFSVKKWSWLYAALFACAPILLYKTGSRTAMGTFLAGLLFVFFFFMRARGVSARWKERVLTLGFFLGLCGSLCLFATPQMRENVTNFVFKTRGVQIEKHDQTWKNLTATRQGKVDEMKETIAESPMIGNGFQVSKEMQYLESNDFSKLLSAPIEKGVWIYAVMEEGGCFGMALFLLFLLISFTLLLSRKAYIGAALLFVLVVSNLGEFTMFSMTATGGVYWALIFIALSLDAQRFRTPNNTYPMPLNYYTY